MDKSSIEQKIKEKLSNHQEAINNEDLFAALGIEEQKKKRPFLWIFLGSILLLSGGTILYVQLTSDPQPNIANHDTNTQYVDNSTLDQAEYKTTPSSNTSSLEKEATKPLIRTGESESSTVFGTTTTQNEQYISANKKQNDDASLHDQSLSQLTIPLNNARKEQKNTTQKIITPPSLTFDQKENLTLLTQSQSNQHSEQLLKQNNSALLGLTQNPIIQLDTFYETTLSNGLFYPFLHKSISLELIREDHTHMFAPRPRPFIITPYLAYGRFSHDMISIDTEFDSYRKIRILQEKPLENIRVGTLIDLPVSPFFTMKTGLEYSQYNIQFDYTETERVPSGEDLEIVRINFVGDSTIITSNEPRIDIVNRNWTTYSTFHVVNVPILLSFRYDFYKLGFFAETGVNLGLYSQFNGKILSPELDIVERSAFYKRSFLVSGDLGLGCDFLLNESMRLYGKINYRSSLNSIANKQNVLEERFRHVGLAVGVTYTMYRKKLTAY